MRTAWISELLGIVLKLFEVRHVVETLCDFLRVFFGSTFEPIFCDGVVVLSGSDFLRRREICENRTGKVCAIVKASHIFLLYG
jgi:hypothetical protein